MSENGAQKEKREQAPALDRPFPTRISIVQNREKSWPLVGQKYPLSYVEKSVALGTRKVPDRMYCPQCKAEYREGFTRCADCDVELVKNYVEAGRHPLAKKVAVGDDYGALLWRGRDPHFLYGAFVESLEQEGYVLGLPSFPTRRPSLP